MIVEPNPSPANEVLFNLYCKLEQRMIGAIQTEDTQLLKELCPKAEAEWPQQLSELNNAIPMHQHIQKANRSTTTQLVLQSEQVKMQSVVSTTSLELLTHRHIRQHTNLTLLAMF